jgi:hypothetical protein
VLYLCAMVRSLTQRMFMLIASMVILFNICSTSIIEISKPHSGISSFSSKKEVTPKKHAELTTPIQLVDIEENTVEVEEKEERSESKVFHHFSGFIASGAVVFEQINGINDLSSFHRSSTRLPLFILFENFRL